MADSRHPETPITDTPAEARLTAQFAFLEEAEKLRTVLRATSIGGGSRRENSGEHSWHIALYALILADQAGPGVSIDRVIRMLLLHDLVEIDVGDVPIHAQDGQAHGSAATAALEDAAARRIFGLLPADIGTPLLALWREFEAAETQDAVFAKSLDRVQPVMLNLANHGGTWDEYAVTRSQIEARVGSKVARGAPAVWAWVQARIAPYFAHRP